VRRQWITDSIAAAEEYSGQKHTMQERVNNIRALIEYKNKPATKGEQHA
jgi:hypothetical protein